jgi:hypothetical protein
MSAGRAASHRVAEANAKIVEIAPPTEEAKRLWAKALELATAFGAEDEWSIIGGLMVQLHSFEHQSNTHATYH